MRKWSELECDTSRPWVCVYRNVPYEQTVEKIGKRTIGIKWNVKKPDGRHRCRLVAKEFNDSVDQATCAATPHLEALNFLPMKLAGREREWRDAGMIHMNGHWAFFFAQDRPDTYVEVPEEEKTEKNRACGQLENTVGSFSMVPRGTERPERNENGSRGLVDVCFHGSPEWWHRAFATGGALRCRH